MLDESSVCPYDIELAMIKLGVSKKEAKITDNTKSYFPIYFVRVLPSGLGAAIR